MRRIQFQEAVATIVALVGDTVGASQFYPYGRTHYPHKRRINALFRASLERPVSPFVVGERIRDIVDSGTWTLRHPVGSDASGFLQWRASLTDEQWVMWGAMTDAEWWPTCAALLA